MRRLAISLSRHMRHMRCIGLPSANDEAPWAEHTTRMASRADSIA